MSLAEILEGNPDALIVHLLEVLTVFLPTLCAAREELNDMGDRGLRIVDYDLDGLIEVGSTTRIEALDRPPLGSTSMHSIII